MGLLGDRGNGSSIDARAFLDSTITDRIGQLLDMGLLVAIGTTRDRGAVSVSVTHDGEYDREYFRRSDEASDWLDAVIRAAVGAGLAKTKQDPVTRPLATRRRSKAT